MILLIIYPQDRRSSASAPDRTLVKETASEMKHLLCKSENMRLSSFTSEVAVNMSQHFSPLTVICHRPHKYLPQNVNREDVWFDDRRKYRFYVTYRCRQKPSWDSMSELRACNRSLHHQLVRRRLVTTKQTSRGLHQSRVFYSTCANKRELIKQQMKVRQ